MARWKGLGVHFRFGSNGYPEPSEDVRLLADSMETILKTYPGERVHRPTFGSYLKRLLFANMTQANVARAKTEARQAIETWEPRVVVQDIEVETVDSRVQLTVYWQPRRSRQQERLTLEFGA